MQLYISIREKFDHLVTSLKTTIVVDQTTIRLERMLME